MSERWTLIRCIECGDVSTHLAQSSFLSTCKGGEPHGPTESIEVEAVPAGEFLTERVERLEEELVDAEAAVQRKRDEDGP